MLCICSFVWNLNSSSLLKYIIKACKQLTLGEPTKQNKQNPARIIHAFAVLCSWSLVCHSHIVFFFFFCICKCCPRLVCVSLKRTDDHSFSHSYVERVCCCVAKSRIYGTCFCGSLIGSTVTAQKELPTPAKVIRLISWALHLFSCM